MIKFIKNIAKRLFTYLFDKPLQLPSKIEQSSVNDLVLSFKQIPNYDTNNSLPSEKIWLSNLNQLKNNVINQNPREFLRWDVIRNSMFVDNEKYLKLELNYLKNHSNWHQRWRKSIIESSIGHPPPYKFYPKSSGNLIHHTYNLAQFEENSNFNVSDFDFVLEFGGGYGSMCRLFYNLGFRGKYIIFDLLPFSTLQTFYLQSLPLPMIQKDECITKNNGICCISDINLLETICNQNKIGKSLFIANWSLSESPINLRNLIFPIISNFNSYFFAFQNKFEEIDNIDYFSKLQHLFTHVVWHQNEIEHLPGNFYLIGS